MAFLSGLWIELTSLFAQAMALKDNHEFAVELPIEISASWDLPILDERYWLDADLSRLPQDKLSVRPVDLVPDSPTDTSPFWPPALSATTGEEQVPDSDSDSQVVTADMAMDAREDLPIRLVEKDVSMDDDETLRLRGGAEGAESDEEYDDEGEDEDEVELGLLKAMPESWDVDLGVGKVGGVPRWIDPTSPLSLDDVTCSKCGEPMSFLLQVRRSSFSESPALLTLGSFAGQLSRRRTTSCCEPSPLHLHLSNDRLPFQQGLARPDAFAQPLLPAHHRVGSTAQATGSVSPSLAHQSDR